MYLFYVALGLGVLATVLFLYVRVKKGGIPGLLTKTVASLFFILTAVFASLGEMNALYRYGIFIIVGLVFGMLGDIWLDLKWIYPKDNDIYTYSGMTCFGIGHIFYLYAIYSLTQMFAASLLYFFIPMAMSLIFGTVAVMLEKPMKMEYGKFKWISLVYGAILSFMTFASGAACIATSWNPVFILMFVGGILFIVSDLVLSGMYFDKQQAKNTPVNVVINHATYYAAQFCIASSIFFLI